MKRKIEKINVATVARYNKRLAEKGAGAYALGWGKKEYQKKRFFNLLHTLEPDDLDGKVVLDVGCGLGDLYQFFIERKINVKKYIGTDINNHFIKIARQRYPNCRFEVRDLMLRPYAKPVADTGVALGVINFKQKDHKKYAVEFINKSFASVRNVLIVNVISDVHNSDYAREPFIYYFKPTEWLATAQQLTPFCSLIHDYAAEPQYEFMLVLRKKPWKLKK